MLSCIIVSANLDMAQSWIRLLKGVKAETHWAQDIDDAVDVADRYNASAIIVDGSEFDIDKVRHAFARERLHIIAVLPERDFAKYAQADLSDYIHFLRRPFTEKTAYSIMHILTTADDTGRQSHRDPRDDRDAYGYRDRRDRQEREQYGQREPRAPQTRADAPPAPPPKDSGMPPISTFDKYKEKAGLPSDEDLERRVEIPLTEPPKDTKGKPLKMIDVIVYTVDALFKYRLDKLKKLVIPWDEIKRRMESLAKRDLSFVGLNGFGAETDAVLTKVRQMNDAPPQTSKTDYGGGNASSGISKYLDKKR